MIAPDWPRGARQAKGQSMRWVICALALLALAPPALADDFDILRGTLPVGPATFTNWSGFYLGGQFGYGNANADFSNATQGLVGFSLRETTLENEQAPSQWPVLGTASSNSTGYGGFVGYNTQWQDVILGVEGNYTHTFFTTTSSPVPISRSVSAGGNTYDVTVNGAGSLDITDYASLRARAGWIVGNFLPYGFAGVVLGRGNYSVSSLVNGQENPSSPPVVPCDYTKAPTCVDFYYPNNTGQTGALLYGVSIGGGLEWALTQNIFLRGEFEYVQFAPVSNIVASIIGARVGVGLKF